MARMLNWWGDVTVIGGLFPMIVADIPCNLKPVDAAYFRKSREVRFGKPLEEVVAGRDKAVEGFRKVARPVAADLEDANLSRRRAAELCGLHRVRRVPVGARGQPVQAAWGRRSGLCLARAAARRFRRHGAQIAGICGVEWKTPRPALCGRSFSHRQKRRRVRPLRRYGPACPSRAGPSRSLRGVLSSGGASRRPSLAPASTTVRGEAGSKVHSPCGRALPGLRKPQRSCTGQPGPTNCCRSRRTAAGKSSLYDALLLAKALARGA